MNAPGIEGAGLTSGSREYDLLEDIETRDDSVLRESLNEVLDAIEDGDASVKRGPYDLSVEGTVLRGWMARTLVRQVAYVVVWSVVDDHWAKIHAIAPSDSF